MSCLLTCCNEIAASLFAASHVCGFVCGCAGSSFESTKAVGLTEQPPEAVTSMDCSESERLNDVVEIILNEFPGGQVCCLLSCLLLN